MEQVNGWDIESELEGRSYVQINNFKKDNNSRLEAKKLKCVSTQKVIPS